MQSPSEQTKPLSAKNEISFSLNEIEVVTPVGSKIDSNTVFERLLNPPDMSFFSSSRTPQPTRIIEYASPTKASGFSAGNNNGFLFTVTKAYADHHPLTLKPCDIMYVISNGLAIHIKQNADKLKEFFSDQEEKYKIVVQRNDFKKGSANNDWFGVFDEFATTTGKTVLDKELIALMQQSFASTTRKSMTARNIAVMDSMSPYCDFELHTMCGIPNITLRGSTEEWNNVRKFANYLRKYGLDWWIDELDKVLEHFVIAHSGITNDNELQSWNDNELPFWNEMVKKSGGSGGPYYNGWISTFFPYSGGDSPKPRKDFTTRFTSGCVPSGISSVDIKWKYFSEEIPLKVHTGMMCCTINKQGSLRPKLLFCVENCGPESKIITVNGFKIGENDVDGFIITDKAKEAVVHGRYCNPAGLHYYNQNKHYLLRYNDPDVVFGADCDLCKAKSINVSIAYCNDYDLCLKCVDRIITFTKSKEPTKIKTWNPYQ